MPSFYDNPFTGAALSGGRGAYGQTKYYGEQKKSQMERQRKKGQAQLYSNLAAYDVLAKQARERMLRGFREFSEAQTSRALGGVMRTAALAGQRRGIEYSGLGMRGLSQAQAELQGQALGAQQQFAVNVESMLAKWRQDVTMQGFDFINRMELLSAQAGHQENLLRLQANLQRDMEARNAFWGLAGEIGNFFGGWAAEWLPLPGGSQRVLER